MASQIVAGPDISPGVRHAMQPGRDGGTEHRPEHLGESRPCLLDPRQPEPGQGLGRRGERVLKRRVRGQSVPSSPAKSKM